MPFSLKKKASLSVFLFFESLKERTLARRFLLILHRHGKTLSFNVSDLSLQEYPEVFFELRA